MRNADNRNQLGQTLALFALALLAMVLGAAVVVDGGFAFAQRRATQNAADFAAMAGTRIVGEALTERPAGAGTGANVRGAIEATLTANDARWADARYVDASGRVLGPVQSSGAVPHGAFGVTVDAQTDWRPFLLGVVGVDNWATSATATAFTPGRTVGGGVMPIGVNDQVFKGMAGCPATDIDDCVDAATPTRLNEDKNGGGQFGWLTFGLQGTGNKCDWEVSLGMKKSSPDSKLCEGGDSDLERQIRQEVDHGCCSAVGTPEGSVDLISGNTGNDPGDALQRYIDEQIPIWVPIWDTYSPNPGMSDSWYHIVGFGAMILTGESQKNEHARWLEGVFIDVDCDNVPGNHNIVQDGVETNFCAAPDGSFTFDTTGEVRLVR